MKIGDTVLPYGLILAPMAGFTDRAMRQICHDFGAEYTVTEMISAKALTMKDKKTQVLSFIGQEEGPTAVQLFGSDADVLATAAAIVENGEKGGKAPVAIDINMGCPVQKIFGNGEGSALMKDPEKIYKIVKAVSAKTSLPVTVKLRAGITKATANAVECAQAAAEGGASMIAVHGRTREEQYSGIANLEFAKSVKKTVSVPVVASGDVVDAASALRILRETGVDGLMIGRGALGNPFVFEEIKAALSGKPYTPPSVTERIQTAKRQYLLAVADKGEDRATREARGQIALYVKRMRGAAAFRAAIQSANNKEEILFALDDVERAYKENLL